MFTKMMGKLPIVSMFGSSQKIAPFQHARVAWLPAGRCWSCAGPGVLLSLGNVGVLPSAPGLGLGAGGWESTSTGHRSESLSCWWVKGEEGEWEEMQLTVLLAYPWGRFSFPGQRCAHTQALAVNQRAVIQRRAAVLLNT